ncbi:hypothetical protein AAHA92_33036 [Salvia divinorum]|uniref:Uncharacterized protein n=1 Tax=Salvia divinorum TaxID=28513 RepID=A0ABD1FQW9_SALDI
MGAGTRGSNEMLPGEIILTLGGPMPIKIIQPRKRKIFRIEWRDHPVGQAEIPRGQTNWVIEVKVEMPTGPAATRQTGPADISREILLIHIHLHIRGDFKEAERVSSRQEDKGQMAVTQQGQRYNNFQYQQGDSHFNQGPGYNQYAYGSGQPFPRQQQKPVDDLVGDLLYTQQNLHRNIQANNDVVHKLQDAQKEQKAAMDMLTRQLSQIATSISEMRGNEERIPATVKMSGKENITSITLQTDGEQVRPKRPLEEEESPEEGGNDKLIKETEEAGDHRKPEEVASKESKETEGKKEVPTTIKENVFVAIRKQKVPTKHSDPGMFMLPISMGSSKIIQAMCVTARLC